MESKQKQEIIEEYCGNNMTKLRRICDPIIFRKGVPEMDHDDLYSAAMDALLNSVERYNEELNCTFNTFLVGNIKRTFYDWTRDRWRGKRCNVERDKNGRIKRDNRKMPIIIPDIRINAVVEDGIELGEKIDSGFNIENELTDFSNDDKWEQFLGKLSKKQRKIAILLSDGYKPLEIKEILHITEKEYSEHLSIIKSYDNISILF